MRGRTSQAVLEGFGLTDSGVEYNEFDRTPALAGAPLRGGWYVVIDHDVEEDFEFDYASEFMAEKSPSEVRRSTATTRTTVQ